VVRLLGDAREFERRHYAILGDAHMAQTGSTFELPRGIVVTVDADVVVLSVGVLAAPTIAADVAHGLPFSGVLGAWRIDVAPSSTAELRLPDGAVLRGRRAGDRLRSRGRGFRAGHKKLQDYYVDRKVPRRERDAAPVIAVGAEVLWTPFGGVAVEETGVPYAVSVERVGVTEA
jgi:tRNA(Ile)-lysidine synthetase-like protein